MYAYASLYLIVYKNVLLFRSIPTPLFGLWVIEGLCFTLREQSVIYIKARKSYISMRWSCCLLCKRSHVELELNCANSLKQQSAGIYDIPFRDIIPIQRQPVFAHTSSYCLLSREAENTNLKVFGLSARMYDTRGEYANKKSLKIPKW